MRARGQSWAPSLVDLVDAVATGGFAWGFANGAVTPAGARDIMNGPPGKPAGRPWRSWCAGGATWKRSKGVRRGEALIGRQGGHIVRVWPYQR
jgi:hypothetical protein